MKSKPLISVIMPTAGRPSFAQAAVEMWRAQTWPRVEMLVIDERVPSRTIGEKRNSMIRAAQGEIVCHWDDDDIYAPERIENQVRRLIETGADITGYNPMLFEDESGQRWRYRNNDPSYCVGVSLMYWRRIAIEDQFDEINLGEDHHWIQRQIRAGRKIVTVDGREIIVARIHSGNTSVKTPQKLTADCWQRVSVCA